VLPAIAAAIHAAAAALPAATPVIATAVVGFGIVATHDPTPEIIVLKGAPEVAAECIRHNAAVRKTRLAAVLQPLYGTATYSIVLKRGGVTGDPVMTVLLQETDAGSTVQFRPLAGIEQDADAVAQMMTGCQLVPAT
jgi:hypothetical protein